MAQTYGIALIPFCLTAGGFLTGKYRRDEALPTGSPRFEEFWSRTGKTHLIPAAFDVLDVVEAMVGEKAARPPNSRWPGACNSLASPAR